MSTKLATIIADFSTQLTVQVAVGGVTASILSATDSDGVALPAGRYFFTINPTNSSKEHISCDLSGTSLTNIKSVSRQGVETTGFARLHRVGASVIISDFAHIKFMDDLLAGVTQFNSSVNLGYDGAPTALAGNQFATVTYVLGVVSGGTVTFDQQIVGNQVAGETLIVNDLVYFKESDQRWWKADADLTATFDQLQLGITKTAGSAGGTIQVAISGPVSGFSGLTAGSKYYLSNTAGGITTIPGTYSVFIGWALTTTTLLFNPVLKTLPTQKEKDALAGSQGTPSSTNKYTTQDNVSSESSDQSQTTQNATVEVGEADATLKKNKIGQSFIPTKTKISAVKLYKSANTGTFTGTVTVSLQADSSGSPSGVALATVTLSNAVYLALTTGEFTAKFSTEYAGLVPGSLYWIVIETSTSDNANHPNLGTNSAGGYSSGSVKFKNITDGWVAIATIDLYFKTIEGQVSQIVQTGTDGTIAKEFLPNKIYLNTTSVVLSNSSTETSIFSMTLPAGTLSTRNVVKIKLSLSDFNCALSGGDDFRIRIKYGGSTLATLFISGSGQTLTGLKGFIEVYLVGNGATNSQKAIIVMHLGGTTAGSTEGAGSATVLIPKIMLGDTGTGSIDSTVDQTISITAEFEVASVSNALTTLFSVVESLQSVSQ